MGFKQKLVGIVLVLFGVFLPFGAVAHQPILEPELKSEVNSQGFYFRAVKILDPTISSSATYGRLSQPGEVDVYVFVPEKSAEIPLEVLVPIRPANENFEPTLYLFSKNLPQGVAVPKDFLGLGVPEDFQMMELANTHSNGIFREPFAQESYWRGLEKKIVVNAKQNYFLVLAEPNKQTGDYSVGVGTIENFENASFIHLLQNIFVLKLGLVGGLDVSWVNLLGIFLMIAGLIIGLGAVTVIDVHGFLGRNSEYWTESTIRAHKVTKPLIWIGIVLWVIGGLVTYRESWFTGVALFQVFLTVILILNGLFLTFYVSPKLLAQEKAGNIALILPKALQSKIMVSFLVSMLGWWTNLFLLVWYIVLMR